MNGYRARSTASWRVSDARPFRPQLLLAAFAVVGVLLMEVWQCSTVASLSEQVGGATLRLQRATAGLDLTRAQLDRASSRASLGPMASASCGRKGRASETRHEGVDRALYPFIVASSGKP